mmetsp:Transcript_6556/g.20466  ORF Transcript_6556/g.20466 Transcript_6556/m.20466 type:complete len:150 (+) Transcript_6556:34-483(+)
MRIFCLLLAVGFSAGFAPPMALRARASLSQRRGTRVEAGCSEAEAKKVIDLAKRKITSDPTVRDELGALLRVTGVLGYGAPSPGVIAVSFTAAFQRKGKPFWTTKGEKMLNNRGQTVGKVQARAEGTNRLVSVVIAKDGGWGKSLNVKL